MSSASLAKPAAKPAAAPAKVAAKAPAKAPVAGEKRKRGEKLSKKERTPEEKAKHVEKKSAKKAARLTKKGKKRNFMRKPRTVTKARVAEVPEEIRKKLARSKARIASKDRAKINAAKKDAWRRKEYFVRAERYVAQYRREARAVAQAKKAAKSAGQFFVEGAPKVAVVVRIRGILGVSPKPRKVLQLMRLRQINNAVFVRLNKSSLSLLKLVEPYVAWGYPSLATIKKLVYKRGFLKIDGKRVPLVDNKQIESHFGNKSLICTEDLIHEIQTAGKNFPTVNRFLWPFKLDNPRGGFRDKGTHFVEGGDAGNREEYINDLLSRMI